MLLVKSLKKINFFGAEIGNAMKHYCACENQQPESMFHYHRCAFKLSDWPTYLL
jgi:hypothetical protein